MSVKDIEKACNSLSVSNCLDYNDLTIRHFHYAHPSVFIWLKELHNSMLVHGFVPESFCNNVIIPNVENRNANCNDPTSYRPISIEPICSKLLEQCLVPAVEPFLCFHSNQFGFVPGGGCNKALFAYRTTVEYFQNNNNRVYVALLDLSKAFDRVTHYGLLTLLMKRSIPLFLINILFSWFCKLYGTVVWNNCLSHKFDIFSGIPEGSIIGPKLFNCIMNEILNALETSHLGCFVNSLYLGALAYADDLLLLSSSLSMLQQMLDLCCEVGKLYDLLFNPSKTVCFWFAFY